MGSIANVATAVSPKVRAAAAAAKLLAKKKAAAKTTDSQKKTTAASKTSKKSTAKKAPRQSKHGEIPWGKIVQMWDGGKSSSEISDTLGFTDKKSNWPYSYTLGLIKRLKAGVEANGRKYKVTARRK